MTNFEKLQVIGENVNFVEKLIHSGYDSDCIFFGSQSPKWNSERRLVEFYTSKYVKPISAEELPNDMRYSKSSWNYINGIEIYYEKKKDRLWKVYEDVGIAYCESCLDFAFFVENFCICCQKQNVQVYRSETRMIENEWIKFCNQTQWKKSDKEPEILFAPKRAKKEGEYYPKITRPTLQNHKHVDIKQSNMKKFYHATDKNELVYSLFNQMKENGEAYFCENGINWEECCSLLDELNSFYITCKEGFCCDMNYIIVESCDLSKLNQ